jgi:hypothetical protein
MGRASLASMVGAPLVILASSYALWWISDRLLYIGPLDRAAFGWAVVIPVWVAAPIVAGFAWQSASPTGRAVAAVLVGGIVTAVATSLIWRSIAYTDCETGAIRSSIEWAGPSFIVGVAIGGGVAVSGALVAQLARAGRPWLAVIIGAVSEVAMVFLAILVAAETLFGPVCRRPPV